MVAPPTPWERVAQSVEHLTFNQRVMGSNPIALTNLIKNLDDKEPASDGLKTAMETAGRIRRGPTCHFSMSVASKTL
jgi:hypothetical protein